MDGTWTEAHLVGLEVSPRWIARAWTEAGLPDQASFGEAVGAYILAMALRDGAEVPGDEARTVVAKIATICAAGPPSGEVMVSIGFTLTEVSGFARVVAAGGY